MKRASHVFYTAALLFLIFTLYSCGSPEKVPTATNESETKTGTRDNTPHCLVPEASGEKTFRQ